MIENNLHGSNLRPIIALVGRPNVGKSTLFNRLVKKRLSLAHATPGLTRDRIYAMAMVNDREVEIIDTAGVGSGGNEAFSEGMRAQTEIAISQADLVLFLVDGLAGVLPGDKVIAQLLRESAKPVVVIVNKAETKAVQESVFDFYELGFDSMIASSAAYGNLDDLFLQVEKQFEVLGICPPAASDKKTNEIPVAILGKPNAGKSSFLNKVLGEERHLVSEIAGTTTDAVDSQVQYSEHTFRLIDTAGVRRKRSIYEETEKMAVSAALCALDRADVAILMLDATQPISEQDQKIAGFIEDKGKGAVIVLNKWDLSREQSLNAEAVIENVRLKLQFLAHAPIRLISAKTGSRVFDVLDEVASVHKEYHRRVSTSQVNKVIEKAQVLHAPPVARGRRVKIYYGAQIKSAPPTFLLSCNAPNDIHFSYRRFLTNQIRETFGFRGVPVKVLFRGKEKED